MVDGDDYVLCSPVSAGSYLPATDHMEFSAPIPDEFPYVDFSSVSSAEVEPLACILEEFVHRAQFSITHFGFTYRLACLIQARFVLEVFSLLSRSPRTVIQAPWLDAHVDNEEIEARLNDLRALEMLKRILFGLSLPDADVSTIASETLEHVRPLLESSAPIRLGHFSTFGGLTDLYDEHGRVRRRTTNGIVESHASAYAYRFLQLHAPPDLQPQIEASAVEARQGIYKTVEEIGRALDEPVPLDLGAVLRLGDFALDGKLFDIRTVPPPEDYLESALPYARYHGALNRFQGIRDAATRLGYQELPLESQVELVIGLIGDRRPGFIESALDDDGVARGREIQLSHELERLQEWLEREEIERPVAGLQRILRFEVVRSTARFMRGVLTYMPDERKFDPSFPSLVKLCRLVDLPAVVYEDGFELFRCEPQEIDRDELTYRAAVHSVVMTATSLIRRDAATVNEQAERLRAHGLLDVGDLAEMEGVDLSQVV